MRYLLKKLGIYNKKTFLNFFIQFVKFGIVGISNTLISLIIYYAFVYLGFYYIIANVFGFLVSVINSFFWNNKFVFTSSQQRASKRLIKTYISYGGVFLLSTVLLYIMVDILRISEIVAPLINLCITVPINFLINKFWTFK